MDNTSVEALQVLRIVNSIREYYETRDWDALREVVHLQIHSVEVTATAEPYVFWPRYYSLPWLRKAMESTIPMSIELGPDPG